MMTLEQRREWLQDRRNGLGSSDAAAAVGMSKWGTPLSVYLDKVGALPDRDSEPKRWGRMLEDVVASAYAEETGRRVEHPPEPLRRHPEHPWLLASADRLAFGPDGDVRLVECKTSASDEEWGEPGTDAVPVPYLLQCQHSLLVWGLEWCDVPVLVRGSDFRVYSVQANARAQEMLIVLLGDLWRRIERREPPAPDWRHPDTPRLLDLLHRPAEGVEVQLPESALVWAEEYRRLGSEAKELERQRDECRARIVELMGAASVGVLADGRRVRRKVVPGCKVEYERKEYVDFRIVNPRKEKTSE